MCAILRGHNDAVILILAKLGYWINLGCNTWFIEFCLYEISVRFKVWWSHFLSLQLSTWQWLCVKFSDEQLLMCLLVAWSAALSNIDIYSKNNFDSKCNGLFYWMYRYRNMKTCSKKYNLLCLVDSQYI